MGLISGIFMGMLFGIALMAGWARMMRYRSAKRIAKVWIMVLLTLVLLMNFWNSVWVFSEVVVDKLKCNWYVLVKDYNRNMMDQNKVVGEEN